jgi:excisionase family DNA binding protein
MEKLLVTANEAAAQLGLSRSKVYELLRAGSLVSVRIGTCRRIPASALQDYIASLVDGDPEYAA